MKKFISLFVLGLVSIGCSIVSPGERGVRISLGTVNDKPLDSGAYLYFPVLYTNVKMNVQVQKTEISATAASKDMQETHTTVAVNWSLDPSKVVETYKNIGTEDVVVSRIINPSVNEIVKSETAHRTAEELLTKRLELKNNIDTLLRERLARYNVLVSDVSITNFSFSDTFTHAIEQKQVSEQRAKQAEYEAQRAAIDAKATANKAKGDAEAMLVKAEAESKANKLKLQTLTAELIHYEAVTRWDGKLPSMMTGNTVPFINVSNK